MSDAFGGVRPSPGEAVGIDTALIAAVVDRFYAMVREDEMIGPIFEEAVHDWPTHLQRLRMFWASVALMTGDYKGQPLQAHFRLPVLTDEHFQRWLSLFEETVEALCSPARPTYSWFAPVELPTAFALDLAPGAANWHNRCRDGH